MTHGEYRTSAETAVSIVFGCLVATLQGDLYPETLERVKQDVLNKVHSTTVRGVVFDMSSVRVLDSFSFECLVKIVRTIKLLGVEAVFSGLQAGVVSSIVDLDIDFEGFQAFFNLEDSLNYLGTIRQNVETVDDEDDEEESEDFEGSEEIIRERK